MSLQELPYYIIREIASYLPYDDADDLCTILGFDARMADMRLYNLNKMRDPNYSIMIRRDFCVNVQIAILRNRVLFVFDSPYTCITYYGYTRLFGSDKGVKTFAQFGNIQITYSNFGEMCIYRLENLTVHYTVEIHNFSDVITIGCHALHEWSYSTLNGHGNILNDVLDTSKYPTFLSFNRELCSRLFKIPAVLSNGIHEKALKYFSKKSISLSYDEQIVNKKQKL